MTWCVPSRLFLLLAAVSFLLASSLLNAANAPGQTPADWWDMASGSAILSGKTQMCSMLLTTANPSTPGLAGRFQQLSMQFAQKYRAALQRYGGNNTDMFMKLEQIRVRAVEQRDLSICTELHLTTLTQLVR